LPPFIAFSTSSAKRARTLFQLSLGLAFSRLL
jgi:hypothetical protein